MIKKMVMLLTFYASMATASEVITNKYSEAVVLTHEEVRAIFTLRKSHWNNGLKIKVFLLPKTSLITKDFLYHIVKIQPDMYFDLMESSYALGKTNIPTIIESEISMINSIVVNPGSIGYIYDMSILYDAGDYEKDLRVIKVKD